MADEARSETVESAQSVCKGGAGRFRNEIVQSRLAQTETIAGFMREASGLALEEVVCILSRACVVSAAFFKERGFESAQECERFRRSGKEFGAEG